MKRKSKSRSRHSKFSKRLAAYSVAAGAAVTSVSDVHATPIRIDLSPYEVIESDPAPAIGDIYDLDLDGTHIGPATTDFRFFHSYTSTFISAEISGSIFANRVAASSTANGFFFYALALNAGDIINSSLPFPAGNNVVIGSDYGNQVHGNFAGQGDKYLGLRFLINSETHYGWALVNVALSDPNHADFTITLKAYGYEDAADTPVAAGAVPEPSALGLLALGATGIAAWRALRKRPREDQVQK